MIFHENPLLADDSHEISSLICYSKKSGKILNCRLLQNIGGALRVRFFLLFSGSNSSRTSKVKRSQQALTLENTMKDTERIEEKMQKLDKEMCVLDAKKAKLVLQQEKLISERDCIELQKIYYTLKIQSEYGITINLSNELYL